ncbi:MAG: NADPH:quinone reductase and related Zn-dependent oxidoreductase [bacterium]|nr:MAG: NADPH:quinone reductase and related Zn-dependent oxidoreductase [bacterium]
MAQSETVRALVLRKAGEGIASAVERVPESALPEGDVTVRISHSTLNYKDGMILKGLGTIVRSYPHVPGVDFAGVVEHTTSPLYQPGDDVILTGWRVGEERWGGYATKARVRAEWLVPMPPGLDARRAMALGTAGFTAMLAVTTLEAEGLSPGDGEVLVTGAAGGVGSVAVALLARLGYVVAASTGRVEAHAYLRALGATRLMDRATLAAAPQRPLQRERWAGAVENVGGTTLAAVAAQMRYGSAIAVCGNTGGNETPLSVIPLLLRGVRLVGIASVMVPLPQRQAAWHRLARLLPRDVLDTLTSSIAPLDHLPALADAILNGKVRGRTVIDLGLCKEITRG